MGTLMESTLTPEQNAMIKKVLIAQTESLGILEEPIVVELLKERNCKTVLDIGCGEGSFFLNLARKLPRSDFYGIDHNEAAIKDAIRKAKQRSIRNVVFKSAFFDKAFERNRYHAVMTRYTLQHSSNPQAFVNAVFGRLNKKGAFIPIESLDAYTDCHVREPVWESFKTSVAAIHKRVGSDDNIGKSLGVLMRNAGFREIRVQVVLCSPSTVGWKRFRTVVCTSAALAHSFFPDLFSRQLNEELNEWINDRKRVEQSDPYLSSAIAHGIKP